MEPTDEQIIDGVMQALSVDLCRSPRPIGSGMCWVCVRWAGHPGRCRGPAEDGCYVEWWKEDRVPPGMEGYIWVTTRYRWHRLLKAKYYHGKGVIYRRHPDQSNGP